MGSEPSDRYYMHLPVWASGNVYCNGAKAWEKEQDAIVCPDRDIFVRAVEQADGWHLSTNLNELSDWTELAILNSEQLGMAFEPEQRFENPHRHFLDMSPSYYEMKMDLLCEAKENGTKK